jgi:hexosaminidase
VRNIDGLSGDREVQDVPGGGSVTGAKVTAWPDTATGDTENQVADQLFASTRFIAQATWATVRPVSSYADFAALSKTLGRAPAYETDPRRPIADGRYNIRETGSPLVLDALTSHVVVGRPPTSWTFTATDDGYYRVLTSDNECLSMRGGTLWLNAPIDSGLPVSAAPCVGDNLEKWWVHRVNGGFQLLNAITQMPLTLENAAGQASSLSGSVLVQRPPDVVQPAVFVFSGSKRG